MLHHTSNPAVSHALMALLPLLFIGIAIPLILGRVRPNFLYGVRTPKTMASPALSYRANRAAGYAMLLATAASLLAWATLQLVPMPPTARVAFDTILLCLANVAALLLASSRAGAF
jgi:hypothetical protein